MGDSAGAEVEVGEHRVCFLGNKEVNIPKIQEALVVSLVLLAELQASKSAAHSIGSLFLGICLRSKRLRVG